jgi:GNAT superfamily N-acetyltransferase
MKILTFTNENDTFYPTLGRYLSNRAVVADLGAPVWDDPGKVWYVAVRRGLVLGFCARVDGPTAVVFCSDYVLPEHRGLGVYTELFQARLATVPTDAVCRATVTEDSLPVYLAHGFQEVRRKGRYIVVAK